MAEDKNVMEENGMHCIICGVTDHLHMMHQKNGKEITVGVVFVCASCMTALRGCILDVTVTKDSETFDIDQLCKESDTDQQKETPDDQG